MKYISVLLLFSFFTITVFAQTSREEYIRKYQLLAIEEMNRSGIPASIKMAQACLESADGASELAKKSNNHFGIKCKSNWTGKKVYHDDDYEGECFRKYNSVEESYMDHTNFLMNNPRYASLFKLDPTDYRNWAHGLKKAGYATATHYDKTLINIIEEFKLYRLDYRMSNDEISAFEQRRLRGNGNSNTLMLDPYQVHQVIKVNGIDAVAAKNGDTYEIIAQEFGLKNWEISKFNDQRKSYVPNENEVVYLKNKNRKTPKNLTTHRVQDGETMHYISQMYGIQLRPLLKRNDMKRNDQPVPGQVIQLRK